MLETMRASHSPHIHMPASLAGYARDTTQCVDYFVGLQDFVPGQRTDRMDPPCYPLWDPPAPMGPSTQRPCCGGPAGQPETSLACT